MGGVKTRVGKTHGRQCEGVLGSAGKSASALTFLAGSTPGVMSAKHRARTSASDEDFEAGAEAAAKNARDGDAAVATNADDTFSVDYDDDAALEELMCELEGEGAVDADAYDDEDSTGDVTTILTSSRSGALRVRMNDAFEALASLAYLAVSPSELDVSKRVAPTPMNTPANDAGTTAAQRSPEVATTLSFESPNISRPDVSPLVARLVRSINDEIDDQDEIERARAGDDFDCFVLPGTSVVVSTRVFEQHVLMILCAVAVLFNIGMHAVAAWSSIASPQVVRVCIEGSYFVPSMAPVKDAATTFVATTFTDAYKAYGPVVVAHENHLAKLAALTSAATRRYRFEFALNTLSYAGAFTAYFSMLCFVLAALSKIMTSVVDALNSASAATSASSSAASNDVVGDASAWQELRGMLTPPLFFGLVNVNTTAAADDSSDDKENTPTMMGRAFNHGGSSSGSALSPKVLYREQLRASSSSSSSSDFTPLAAAPASFTPEIV